MEKKTEQNAETADRKNSAKQNQRIYRQIFSFEQRRDFFTDQTVIDIKRNKDRNPGKQKRKKQIQQKRILRFRYRTKNLILQCTEKHLQKTNQTGGNQRRGKTVAYSFPPDFFFKSQVFFHKNLHSAANGGTNNGENQRTQFLPEQAPVVSLLPFRIFCERRKRNPSGGRKPLFALMIKQDLCPSQGKTGQRYRLPNGNR